MDCYVEKYVALIMQPLALNIICLREESNTYFKNEVFSTICTKKTACICANSPLVLRGESWGTVQMMKLNRANSAKKFDKRCIKPYNIE